MMMAETRMIPIAPYLAVLVVTLVTFPALAQSPPPQIDSINERDLRADLFFIGSDAMRGRLTNTPENLITSEFIKSRFERLGLAAAVPGYFQNYDVTRVTLGPTNTLEVIQNGSPMSVTHGEGFNTEWFSATADVKAPVVFAGYGITAPDLRHDDYRAEDVVKGTIVLVIDHEPGEHDPGSPFDGVVASELSGTLRKAQAAQARGAVGILFVSDVHNHPAPSDGPADPAAGTRAGGDWPPQPPRLGAYSLADWMKSIRIPAARISTATAATLIAGTGRTLEDLSRSSDRPGGIAAVRLPGAEGHLATAVDPNPLSDRNVLAMIQGSDARLRNEWVIVSAHFDHGGADGSQVLNGADDNGSGTVALLEIAEAYALAAKAGRRPRRSVLFASFNSEEHGLLGAWAYTLQPAAPLAQTVAVLNMDMVGRNEEVPAMDRDGRFNGLEPQTAASNANALNIIGSVRTPALKANIARISPGIGLDIKYRYDNSASQLLRRSDHWPFVQNGVPGLWFFTGLHPDYHDIDDDPGRINYEKMARIARLVYQVSWDLAQQNTRPALLPRSAPGVPGPPR